MADLLTHRVTRPFLTYGVQYQPDDLVNASLWPNARLMEEDGSLEKLPAPSVALEQGQQLVTTADAGLAAIDTEETTLEGNITTLTGQVESLRDTIAGYEETLRLREQAVATLAETERALVNTRGQIAVLPTRRAELCVLKHRGEILVSAFEE